MPSPPPRVAVASPPDAVPSAEGSPSPAHRTSPPPQQAPRRLPTGRRPLRAEDGNWLLVQLTPSEATPAKGERNPAVVLRDRFWTEVVSRFDDLYKAGVEVWGRRGVDAHLPALLSRTRAPATQSPARPAPAAEAAPPA